MFRWPLNPSTSLFKLYRLGNDLKDYFRKFIYNQKKLYGEKNAICMGFLHTISYAWYENTSLRSLSTYFFTLNISFLNLFLCLLENIKKKRSKKTLPYKKGQQKMNKIYKSNGIFSENLKLKWKYLMECSHLKIHEYTYFLCPQIYHRNKKQDCDLSFWDFLVGETCKILMWLIQ